MRVRARPMNGQLVKRHGNYGFPKPNLFEVVAATHATAPLQRARLNGWQQQSNHKKHQ